MIYKFLGETTKIIYLFVMEREKNYAKLKYLSPNVGRTKKKYLITSKMKILMDRLRYRFTKTN